MLTFALGLAVYILLVLGIGRFFAINRTDED